MVEALRGRQVELRRAHDRADRPEPSGRLRLLQKALLGKPFTERFFDKYSGGRAGQYLLDRYADKAPRVGRADAARRVEEAQLFIEAAHACEARSLAQRAPTVGPVEIPPPSPAEA